MPSAFVVNPEEFVAPIPGDNPSGRRVSLAEVNQLKQYQEDFDPERDLSEEDRRNPQFAEAKRVVPRWDAIVEFGTRYLTTIGKDLEVAVRMVEALTKQQGGGFAGAKTGFQLLRRLCEECWDRMHPALDPDDPDAITDRTSKLEWLDDPEKKPYYPTTLRGIPLLETGDGVEISFLTCQQSRSRAPKVSPDEFRQAVNTARPSEIDRVRMADEDITEALAELRTLQAVLEARASGSAPGFVAIRKALIDCQTMTQQVLRMRRGESDPSVSEIGDQPQNIPDVTESIGAANVEGKSLTTRVANPQQVRDEIYAEFERLVGLLEQYDPHSPVTLLIRRALELRDKKFPALVDVLTRDSRVLDFLRNPVD